MSTEKKNMFLVQARLFFYSITFTIMALDALFNKAFVQFCCIKATQKGLKKQKSLCGHLVFWVSIN